ncbi:MAG: BamA/TamA family outer membrane protein [Paludibacteraceae bacterium]|nr:BamA/TamA family outer membrane protein [Paludibacteraceae bacterium]
MRNKAYIWLLAVLFCSCNTTKFVPQGEYLLDKANVKCVDDKKVSTNTLRAYLRQKQNTEIMGFWKLQLDIYNTAPRDTTTKSNKRLARNAHKMGEAPVVYDEELTKISMLQLKQQMNNMGYFHAEVDTQKVYKKRKVRLTYLVTAHQPYTIRNYEVDIPVDELRAVAQDRVRCKIKEGDQFSTETLDEERTRIASAVRNRGYFYFEKSMLEFTADSSLNSHEVDVRIHLAPFVEEMDSAQLARLHTQYFIRNVNYTQDHNFLRRNALRHASRLRDGDRYAEWRVERTYARMNALPPVKYVDIAFTPAGDSLLDCTIALSRGRLNSISAELEGTYSAGNWGIAAGLNYSNKNIFRGAELLTVGARASYEWRANGSRAIEGKAEAGLLFASNVKVSIGYNYQQRPDEYTRTMANATLGYLIPRKPGSRWTHQFNLVDINYIYLPWISERFRTDFLEKSSVLKSSYEDQFIVDWSYTCSYSNYNPRHPERSYVQLAMKFETAGNFLYLLSKWCGFSKNEQGSYLLWKIPFAQYAKADFNFAYHGVINPKHQIVTHIGAGVIVPYLNSTSVPFQKRYFGGGANGNRGWQARTLGPGTFKGNGASIVYDLQAGDIHLDANLEYRFKVLKFLELAAFTDAGNIWTIDNYLTQPGGVFKFDEFYKQIAWSYGAGIRFDLNILIFRVDFGVKLFDPGRTLEGKQWRTASNGLGWKDDMTFHFAIGYPF